MQRQNSGPSCVIKLRDELREATLDFVAGYLPLRENAVQLARSDGLDELVN